MVKLAKYLKPYLIPLALAIALLAVQANGELTLPEMMSKLVNTGIQQNGIDSPAPKVISFSTLMAAKDYADNPDLVMDSYAELKITDKNLKKYPAMEYEPIFERTAKGDALDELEMVMSKALLAMAFVEQNAPQGLYERTENGVELRSPQVVTMFVSMTRTQLLAATNEIIKAEYTHIGIDMEKYPVNYVVGQGGYMLFLCGIIMLTVILEAFFAGRIGAGIGRDLRRDVFAKIVGFSSNEFDKFSTASLITRSTNDITQIQNIVGFLLRIVVFSPIMGIGGIIKVLKTNSDMVWIIALAVAILIAVVIVMLTLAVPRFRKVQELIDKVNLVMREALSGILVIRAFSNQKYEKKKFAKANKDLTDMNLFVARLMSAMFPLMTIIMNGVSLLIVWVGADKIGGGTLQVGDMMAFITYAMQIIMSFLMISMISMILPRAMVSAKRISEVLETENSINDAEHTLKINEAQRGEVEFKNVSFKYPNADDYVIKDITFTAKAGQTTAFIGATGSGKSTLVNLIPRFYDTTEGELLVGGVNVKMLPQKDLRDVIGYIPQKSFLFSGTIESNVKYSNADMDEKTVEEAVEIAQAADFINEKPDKFQERVSQDGTNVSGGQRQRLAIARALAKKPPIYIFDDSFSALDYATDAKLRAGINEKLSGSTVLIVGQRIGTIKNADKIIVLEQGQIAGVGTHRELLANCEEYRQIALSQLSQEELDRDLKTGGGING